MWWIPLLLGALGGGLGAAGKMSAQRRENQVAADQQNRGMEAEQRRAAKMEDVAGMFRSFGQGSSAYSDQMAGIARALATSGAGFQDQVGQMVDSRPMLEMEAARQLERNSGTLDAALASRGVYSSGQGVRQQGLLAAETMGGLSGQIAQDRQAAHAARLQALMGGQQMQMQGQQAAAGIYGGMSQQDMQRQLAMLQGVGGLYGDPSFGQVGATPYQPPQPGVWDQIMGFFGGAAGGAGTMYGANPGPTDAWMGSYGQQPGYPGRRGAP